MLATLLFRCADELQTPLEGCWYKQKWRARQQAPEPSGSPVRIHRDLSIPRELPALRSLFRARLKARGQRRLSLQLLKILGQQRRDLAHALHAGPCQTMTAAQLTLGLLEVAPDPETLKELELSVVQAGLELRELYEAQLCLFPEGQKQLYSTLQIQLDREDQLLFEFLLAARKADPQLSVSQFEDELWLEFTKDEGPEKISDFIEALRARGDRIKRSGALVSLRVR
ncbi:MAG: hypothetical protein KF760_03530 [Candidatus Eremiobacteraeota bacterium]|nr:hypothetical protein [Candidatus Eremiobacteraeota bacterium]MCW5872334.1 hypothetical protein [Candidatus Eremiobacteraeota bacterium]